MHHGTEEPYITSMHPLTAPESITEDYEAQAIALALDFALSFPLSLRFSFCRTTVAKTSPRFGLHKSRKMDPPKNVLLGDFSKSLYFVKKEFDGEGPATVNDKFEISYNIDINSISDVGEYSRAVVIVGMKRIDNPNLLDFLPPQELVLSNSGSVLKISGNGSFWHNESRDIYEIEIRLYDNNNNMSTGLSGYPACHLEVGKRLNAVFYSTDINDLSRWWEIGSPETNVRQIGQYYLGARYYDPEVGVFTSTDPMQQFWSPYKYASNPISMVDPDGMFFGMGPVSTYLLFSQTGYDIQKATSPVAMHLNWGAGTASWGSGVEFSVGAPTSSPISTRRHFGATYYTNYYDNSYSGWASMNGVEWGVPGYSISGTTIESGDISQVIYTENFGLPSLMARISNDGIGATISGKVFGAGGVGKLPGMPVSNEDRYRTAAVSVDGGIVGFPGIKIGTNLFTGDPGPEDDRRSDKRGSFEYYMKSGSNDPNQYRAGVLSFSVGPIRFGGNNERIRHTFQNKWIHDTSDPRIPRFSVLDRQPELYFYFGSGSGSTLW